MLHMYFILSISIARWPINILLMVLSLLLSTIVRRRLPCHYVYDGASAILYIGLVSLSVLWINQTLP